MQTQISPDQLAHPGIHDASAILRACVHCGFCAATCPTYQLLGNELDSPRGRIYLIKEMLEGKPVTAATRTHLDRCLTCRACETTCPSGVQYAQLLDIGRQEIDRRAPRGRIERMMRKMLLRVLTNPSGFARLLAAGRVVRPLLPTALRNKIPARHAPLTPTLSPQVGRGSVSILLDSGNTSPLPTCGERARVRGDEVFRNQESNLRRMIILEGCVQPTLTPATNAAAAAILNHLGITLIAAPQAGCCGALHQHLGERDAAEQFMRRNIDAWWPLIEQGAEAIVITASGCGTTVKEYGHLLRDDPQYAAKAARVSALTRDLSEVLCDADLSAFAHIGNKRRVAYHPPCSLQHGQKNSGAVEDILRRCGYELVPVADSHLCCGAAGTYTLLQPALSTRLLENKLAALQHAQPDFIVSANVGCELHLASAANVPVKHWIELLTSN
jgi:glycolate oxidase iron-sulfur subunit